jgi:hypothetical protein
MRDGSVVVAFPNPGLWAPLASLSKRTGHPLIADNRVRPAPDGRSFTVRASIRAFGEMADGTILVYYLDHDPVSFAKGESGHTYYRLAILKPDGTLIATIAPDDNYGNEFVVSRDGKELFMASSDPFPQVVRMRLERAR